MSASWCQHLQSSRLWVTTGNLNCLHQPCHHKSKARYCLLPGDPPGADNPLELSNQPAVWNQETEPSLSCHTSCWCQSYPIVDFQCTFWLLRLFNVVWDTKHKLRLLPPQENCPWSTKKSMQERCSRDSRPTAISGSYYIIFAACIWQLTYRPLILT